jgi:Ca2+-binding RTX toxin-like protein
MIVTGTNKAETLAGTADNDIINGLGGIDTILAGYGDDILIGGSGNDTFIFDAFFGHDVITDFSSNETIVFGWGTFVDFADVLDSAQDVGGSAVITLDEVNSITLSGVSVSALSADDFVFA